MKLVKPSQKQIFFAVKSLKAGKVIVYPTDTSYGFAVDAMNAKAVKKLYRLKGRNFGKPIHVVVASLAMAKKIAKFDRRAEKIFKKFLPGALTIVLAIKTPSNSPFERGRKISKLLTAGTGKIGIRMPKNKVALELVEKFGRPITATSANISGKPATYSAQSIKKQFKYRKLKPDLILDAGRLPRVKPSTVLDLTGKRVKILRQGPVNLKEIKKVLSYWT